MALTQHVGRYATRKVINRLARSLPWIGGVVAVVTLGSAIRRKGFVGGTAHTALDMIPYVGGAKNLVELGRGRDFIRDRPIRTKQRVTPLPTVKEVPAFPTPSRGPTPAR